MKVMKFEELFPLLEDFQFKAPIFLGGPEKFLKEHFFQHLRKSFKNKWPEGDILWVYPGRDPEKILLNQQQNLFGNLHPLLIIIENFEGFTAKQRKSVLSKSPLFTNPQNFLFISYSGTEIEKDFKELPFKPIKLVVWSLFENQVPEWVRNQFSRLGKSCSQSVALQLSQACEFQVETLWEIIQRMVVFLGEKKQVPLEDCRAFFPTFVHQEIYSILPALGRKEFPRAVSIIQNQLGSGVAASRIFYILAGFFKELAILKSLCDDFPAEFQGPLKAAQEYGQIMNQTDFKSNSRKKQLHEFAGAWLGEKTYPPLILLKGKRPQKLLENLFYITRIPLKNLQQILDMTAELDIEIKYNPSKEENHLIHYLANLSELIAAKAS